MNALQTNPDAAANIATATGLLTVDLVAATLGVQPLAVLRLIARGKLEAVTIGVAPDPKPIFPGSDAGIIEPISYRIPRPAFDRFSAGGCKDQKMPPIDGDWFFDRDTEAAATRFSNAAKSAAEAECRKISYATVLDMFKQRGIVPTAIASDKSIECELEYSSALKRIGDQPDDNFGKSRDAFLVDQMRAAARRAIQKPGVASAGILPINVLYGSTALYDQVCMRAYEQLQKSSAIGFTSFYVAPTEAVATSPNDRTIRGSTPTLTIRWALPMKQLLDGVMAARLAAMAF